MKQHHPENQQSGFTIIELMIATSILSTMLVMVTAMMINLGNLFYKGVNQARVQDATRSTAEELSHNVELTNALPLSTPIALMSSYSISGSTFKSTAYCIDTVRYSYIIGVQIGTPPIKHVLWRDTVVSGASCVPANLTAATPSATGTELITPNSRLTNFNISPLSPYALSVGIAYGDDDLLCSPSVVGSCTTPNKMVPQSNYALPDLHCKGKTGDQFCAVSTLKTTVLQRIN